MNKLLTLICVFVLGSLIAASAPAQQSVNAEAPSTPFTYQGKLALPNGLPANGNFDFLITVFDLPIDGQEITRVEIDAVSVVDGIFTVTLPFGRDVFMRADATYLDVQVRTEGGGSFSQLSPRIRIGSSPYSKIAETSTSLSCAACVTDNQIVSLSGAKITGSVASANSAVNATFATNAVTAQTALNAVDLTNAQTVGGNKTFTGILSGNGSGLINVPGTLKWNVNSTAAIQLQSNNGYVLTNTVPSTVTLPAAPAIGDVVRVMEKGTGGFTLAMNSGQSILDWATTHTETIWTRQYSVIASTNTNIWSGVASSSDGLKLAAVEYPGIIATSTNGGQTWTARTEEVRNYTAIASSSDGTRLIAAVEGGFLYTSTDSGITWTARFADSNRYWYSVASSADGLKLVASDITGVYTSTDGGVIWTRRRTTTHLSKVASSADGTKLVAAEYLGDIYTSSNSGALWFDRYTPTGNSQWESVASDSTGAKIVAVRNYGEVVISSDFGVNWTLKTIGPSGTHTNWTAVTVSSDGMRIAAVGPNASGLYPGSVNISYDGGNSWTLTGSGTNWTTAAIAGNGNRLAVGMDNQDLNRLYSGPIGTVSVVDTITGVKDSAVELVYIGSNQFAMVSSTNMSIPPHTY